MSRSRRNSCSVGRGCRVCGHAGAVVEARQADAVRVDDAELPDNLDANYTEYICTEPSCSGWGCGDLHVPVDVVEDKPVFKVSLSEVATELAGYLDVARAVRRALPVDLEAERAMARAMAARSKGYTSRKLLPKKK